MVDHTLHQGHRHSPKPCKNGDGHENHRFNARCPVAARRHCHDRQCLWHQDFLRATGPRVVIDPVDLRPGGGAQAPPPSLHQWDTLWNPRSPGSALLSRNRAALDCHPHQAPFGRRVATPSRPSRTGPMRRIAPGDYWDNSANSGLITEAVVVSARPHRAKGPCTLSAERQTSCERSKAQLYRVGFAATRGQWRL